MRLPAESPAKPKELLGLPRVELPFHDPKCREPRAQLGGYADFPRADVREPLPAFKLQFDHQASLVDGRAVDASHVTYGVVVCRLAFGCERATECGRPHCKRDRGCAARPTARRAVRRRIATPRRRTSTSTAGGRRSHMSNRLLSARRREGIATRPGGRHHVAVRMRYGPRAAAVRVVGRSRVARHSCHGLPPVHVQKVSCQMPTGQRRSAFRCGYPPRFPA